MKDVDFFRDPLWFSQDVDFKITFYIKIMKFLRDRNKLCHHKNKSYKSKNLFSP